MEGPIWVAGAMSGTSLDGVDAALLKTDGRRIFDFGETRYRAYREEERDVIRAALGSWPGDGPATAAAEVVETAHAAVLSRLKGAEMVGFHGQTLAHDPRGRGTHQAGDGQVLADALTATPGLNAQAVQYREGALFVALVGSDLQQLEALRSWFGSKRAATLEVQSANSGSEGVQIRIKLTPA